MSRFSQIVGASFESWIEAQHTVALARGILAHIEHHEPHAKKIGSQFIHTRAGVSDYGGVLSLGATQRTGFVRVDLDVSGHAVAIEAKSTQEDRLPRSAIRKRQAEHLDAVARAGGLALLLVEFRPRKYAIPWLEIKWTTLRTAESVAEADVTEWRIPEGACYLERFVAPGRVVGATRRYPRE